MVKCAPLSHISLVMIANLPLAFEKKTSWIKITYLRFHNISCRNQSIMVIQKGRWIHAEIFFIFVHHWRTLASSFNIWTVTKVRRASTGYQWFFMYFLFIIIRTRETKWKVFGKCDIAYIVDAIVDVSRIPHFTLISNTQKIFFCFLSLVKSTRSNHSYKYQKLFSSSYIPEYEWIVTRSFIFKDILSNILFDLFCITSCFY